MRPIRVAQFVKSFHLGGTEGQVVELLRGLSGVHGLEVRVGVLQRAGPLLAQVEALGMVPEAFPLGPSYAHPQTLRQMLRVARWLAAARVDLVHAHDLYSTLLVGPVARALGLRLLVGRLDLAHFHSRSQRAVLSAITRSADGVIANAEAIRGMLLEEEGCDASRVHVLRNGLALSRFDARARAGLSAPLPDAQGHPVVVHVANLAHPVKRQEDLLDAVARLHARGSPVRAWLVGDGPRRAEVEARRDALGLSGAVQLLGHRVDVPAVLAHAHVGVLCSSAEGLSNAVMEGMAAGLPMVVTRVGGNPELVQHGERGLVVEPCRPAELAEAISELLAEPGRARQMGERARAFVASHLSVDRLCQAHAELYRAVLASRPTTSRTEAYPPAFNRSDSPERISRTSPGPS